MHCGMRFWIQNNWNDKWASSWRTTCYPTEKYWLLFVQRHPIRKTADWWSTIQGKFNTVYLSTAVFVQSIQWISKCVIVKAPEPIDSWAPSVLDAFEHGNICYQNERFVAQPWPQSEDCLTLNVYVPGSKANAVPFSRKKNIFLMQLNFEKPRKHRTKRKIGRFIFHPWRRIHRRLR